MFCNEPTLPGSQIIKVITGQQQNHVKKGGKHRDIFGPGQDKTGEKALLSWEAVARATSLQTCQISPYNKNYHYFL